MSNAWRGWSVPPEPDERLQRLIQASRAWPTTTVVQNCNGWNWATTLVYAIMYKWTFKSTYKKMYIYFHTASVPFGHRSRFGELYIRSVINCALITFWRRHSSFSRELYTALYARHSIIIQDILRLTSERQIKATTARPWRSERGEVVYY